jgi:isocitrate dehydrogenase
MQTPGVAEALKLISRKGCEKIVRLGFELARAEGRKKVHCATKSNIMKMTEGTLKRTFEAIAPEYPEIEAQHIIVDNCAHQLVRFPEWFEVIITGRRNGDILSDMTSGLIGLGWAPSAGLSFPTRSSRPCTAPIRSKNTISPDGVIFATMMMLPARGVRRRDENSIVTLEEGVPHPRRPGRRRLMLRPLLVDRRCSRLGEAPRRSSATTRRSGCPTFRRRPTSSR